MFAGGEMRMRPVKGNDDTYVCAISVETVREIRTGGKGIVLDAKRFLRSVKPALR